MRDDSEILSSRRSMGSLQLLKIHNISRDFLVKDNPFGSPTRTT